MIELKKARRREKDCGEDFMTGKNEQTEDTLLRRIRGGDGTAVGDLYLLFNTVLRHTGLKYLHDKQSADAYVQDFWADIEKIAAGYRFSKNARSYLTKVATRRAIDEYRRSTAREAHITYVDYSLLCGLPDGGERETERYLIIDDAMHRLSEEERIIIQSTYFGGLTVREIAREMKLTKSTVQRLKDRALEKLRKELCHEK